MDRYEYTVTATVGGNPAEAAADGNTYTVANVSGNVVFTVNKAAVSDTEVSVSEYLTLNEGNAVWLVKAAGTLEEGKVFAYDGTAMYFSEKYNAYCWLVISDAEETEIRSAAEAAVSEVSAEKITVDYSGDVNGTGLVDVNDAQLIWNMYNAFYDSFESCSMLKFLRADMNSDTTVNTQDAASVIDLVLCPAVEEE